MQNLAVYTYLYMYLYKSEDCSANSYLRNMALNKGLVG